MINYSFIIPHKNCPELLERCVDSIPERDDVQVIIVDDNSDDDKKPMLKKQPNLQIVLLDATQAKGAGSARNIGLKYAMGKWLIFADSDDFFSDALSDLLDNYMNSTSDIIYFKAAGLNSDTLEPVSRGNKYNRLLDIFKSKHNDLSEDMLKYCHVIPWCKIIRRSLVTDNNIKFEEVKYSNDVMFVTYVAHYSNKIEVSDIVAYCVTERPGSLITHKNAESSRCRFDVSMRRMKFLWDNHKWRMSPSKLQTLFSVLRRYGWKELKAHVKIMKKNCVGWDKVIIGEIAADYYRIKRHYCL